MPPPSLPPTRKRRTRLLKLVTASTLLGILTTAMLILLAVCITMRWGTKYRQIRETEARWIWPPPSGWAANPLHANERRSFGHLRRGATSLKDGWDTSDRATAGHQSIEEVGFPFTATVYRESSDMDNLDFPAEGQFLTLYKYQPAIAFDHMSSPLPFQRYPALLPLLPWWPGLLADIAIWSTLWCALLITPRAIRNHRRTLAGRCTSCNYPLATLPTCPECGTPAPTSPSHK